MPIIHVDIVPELMHGDRQEQYATMAARITDAVVTSTGAPVESVHVLISEVSDARYSVGGALLRGAVAEAGAAD